MDNLGCALHRGVRDVDGERGADADHREHERERDEEQAQHAGSLPVLPAGGHAVEERRRVRRGATGAQRAPSASEPEVAEPREGGENADAQIPVLEEDHRTERRQEHDDIQVAHTEHGDDTEHEDEQRTQAHEHRRLVGDPVAEGNACTSVGFNTGDGSVALNRGCGDRPRAG